MKRFFTAFALCATLALAATSCKKDKQPDTPRIAPQIWATEELMQEGKYNLHMCFFFDGNGNAGFGFMADKEYAEYLHECAKNVEDESMKAKLENAKENDILLSMMTYDLVENEDKVSGTITLQKQGETVQTIAIVYSGLTTDSVTMSVSGAGRVAEAKCKTPAALGITAGEIIDATSLY